MRSSAEDFSAAQAFPLLLALELYELAVQIVAQNYRRRHPAATDEEVAAVIEVWRHDRPGAPYGDAEGRCFSTWEAWLEHNEARRRSAARGGAAGGPTSR